MPKEDLPSSPAARAFFAALDTSTTSSSSSSPSTAGSTSFVQKRIQTLGWRNRHSQDDFYPVTIANTEFSVRQVQRGEVEGTYGTGATVWPAAVVLMKYLEKHADALVRGKRCIDLGSGTGVTSVAAALLGARQVVCTDGEPNVVQLAAYNLQHVLEQLNDANANTNNSDNAGKINDDTNRVSVDVKAKTIQNCPIHVQKYWWGAGSIQGGNHADLLLVADCVLPKLYPMGPLVNALAELLTHDPHAVAILSYEYRYYPDFDPATEFRRLCQAKGLVVTSIPLSEQDDVYSVDDIEIWHVRRQQQPQPQS